MADMVTRIPDILNLVSRDGAGVATNFLIGQEYERALDQDKNLVVCLFNDGRKDIDIIKQFFVDVKPEKMTDIPFKHSG